MFFQRTRKPTSLLIIACFLFADLLHAHPGPFFPAETSAAASGLVEIPSFLGTVEESVPASNPDAPRIIHIKTMHGHYETAVKVKELAGHLREKYGIDLVFAEGASVPLDPRLLEFHSSKQTNQKILDVLARKGELTGADLLAAEGAEVFGIEDAPLYREAFENFKDVLGRADETAKRLEAMRLALDKKASRIMSPGLRGLIEAKSRFDSEKQDASGTLAFLRGEARKEMGLDFENVFSQFDWPQTTRLVSLGGLEQKLREGGEAAEYEKLRGWISGNGIAAGLPDYLEASGAAEELAVLKGRAPRELAEEFIAQASAKGFQFSAYPQFTRRAALKVLQSELDAEELFEEFERLFKTMLEARIKTNEERALAGEYERLSLLGKLLRLELTAADWKALENYRTAFEFPDAEVLNEALGFYRSNADREPAFLKNVRRILAEKNKKAAVLITGGFHADGMKELFLKEGMGYISVTPHLSGFEGNPAYARTMLRSSSLEQTLLAQPPRISLNGHGWDVAAQRGAVVRAAADEGFEIGPEASYIRAVEAALSRPPERSELRVPQRDDEGIAKVVNLQDTASAFARFKKAEAVEVIYQTSEGEIKTLAAEYYSYFFDEEDRLHVNFRKGNSTDAELVFGNTPDAVKLLGVKKIEPALPLWLTHNEDPVREFRRERDGFDFGGIQFIEDIRNEEVLRLEQGTPGKNGYFAAEYYPRTKEYRFIRLEAADWAYFKPVRTVWEYDAKTGWASKAKQLHYYDEYGGHYTAGPQSIMADGGEMAIIREGMRLIERHFGISFPEAPSENAEINALVSRIKTEAPLSPDQITAGNYYLIEDVFSGYTLISRISKTGRLDGDETLLIYSDGTGLLSGNALAWHRPRESTEKYGEADPRGYRLIGFKYWNPWNQEQRLAALPPEARVWRLSEEDAKKFAEHRPKRADPSIGLTTPEEMVIESTLNAIRFEQLGADEIEVFMRWAAENEEIAESFREKGINPERYANVTDELFIRALERLIRRFGGETFLRTARKVLDADFHSFRTYERHHKPHSHIGLEQAVFMKMAYDALGPETGRHPIPADMTAIVPGYEASARPLFSNAAFWRFLRDRHPAVFGGLLDHMEEMERRGVTSDQKTFRIGIAETLRRYYPESYEIVSGGRSELRSGEPALENVRKAGPSASLNFGGEAILRRFGFEPGNFDSSKTWHLYEKIRNAGDITEEEHSELFDYLWAGFADLPEDIGRFPESLKRKVIANRDALPIYLIASGNFEITGILYPEAMQPFTPEELKYLWDYFDFRSDSKTEPERSRSGYLTGDPYLKAMIEAAGPESPVRVLDLGAGRGQALEKLKSEYGKRVEVTGVDLTLRNAVSGMVIQGDVTDLPLEDGSIDFAYESHVFIHLSPKQFLRALREVHRVLRPGGKFVMTNPIGYYFWKIHDALESEGLSFSVSGHKTHDALVFEKTDPALSEREGSRSELRTGREAREAAAREWRRAADPRIVNTRHHYSSDFLTRYVREANALASVIKDETGIELEDLAPISNFMFYLSLTRLFYEDYGGDFERAFDEMIRNRPPLLMEMFRAGLEREAMQKREKTYSTLYRLAVSKDVFMRAFHEAAARKMKGDKTVRILVPGSSAGQEAMFWAWTAYEAKRLNPEYRGLRVVITGLDKQPALVKYAADAAEEGMDIPDAFLKVQGDIDGSRLRLTLRIVDDLNRNAGNLPAEISFRRQDITKAAFARALEQADIISTHHVLMHIHDDAYEHVLKQIISHLETHPGALLVTNEINADLSPRSEEISLILEAGPGPGSPKRENGPQVDAGSYRRSELRVKNNAGFERARKSAEKELKKILGPDALIEVTDEISSPENLDPGMLSGWTEFIAFSGVTARYLRRIIITYWDSEQFKTPVFYDGRMRMVNVEDTYGAYEKSLGAALLNAGSWIPARLVGYHEFAHAILHAHGGEELQIKEKGGWTRLRLLGHEAKEYTVDYFALAILRALENPDAAPYEEMMMRRGEIDPKLAAGIEEAVNEIIDQMRGRYLLENSGKKAARRGKDSSGGLRSELRTTSPEGFLGSGDIGRRSGRNLNASDPPLDLEDLRSELRSDSGESDPTERIETGRLNPGTTSPEGFLGSGDIGRRSGRNLNDSDPPLGPAPAPLSRDRKAGSDPASSPPDGLRSGRKPNASEPPLDLEDLRSELRALEDSAFGKAWVEAGKELKEVLGEDALLEITTEIPSPEDLDPGLFSGWKGFLSFSGVTTKHLRRIILTHWRGTQAYTPIFFDGDMQLVEVENTYGAYDPGLKTALLNTGGGRPARLVGLHEFAHAVLEALGGEEFQIKNKGKWTRLRTLDDDALEYVIDYLVIAILRSLESSDAADYENMVRDRNKVDEDLRAGIEEAVNEAVEKMRERYFRDRAEETKEAKKTGDPFEDLIILDETADPSWKPVMAEAGKRLLPEEETVLFQALHAKDLTEDERRDLFSFLIRQFLPFTRHVAKKLGFQSEDDLLEASQDGVPGLMEAVKRFDYQTGTRFYTYAFWWVRQSIQRGGAVQTLVPRIARDRLKRYKAVKKRLAKRLEREPSIEEWAEELGIDETELMQVLTVNRGGKSLDTPLAEDGASSLYQIYSDQGAQRPDEIAAERQFKQAAAKTLAKKLERLDPREQLIIKMRFGIGTKDGDARTLDEIGAMLGVTRERIRQIETKVMEKMEVKTWMSEVYEVSEDHGDVFLAEELNITPGDPAFDQMRGMPIEELRMLRDGKLEITAGGVSKPFKIPALRGHKELLALGRAEIQRRANALLAGRKVRLDGREIYLAFSPEAVSKYPEYLKEDPEDVLEKQSRLLEQLRILPEDGYTVAVNEAAELVYLLGVPLETLEGRTFPRDLLWTLRPQERRVFELLSLEGLTEEEARARLFEEGFFNVEKPVGYQERGIKFIYALALSRLASERDGLAWAAHAAGVPREEITEDVIYGIDLRYWRSLQYTYGIEVPRTQNAQETLAKLREEEIPRLGTRSRTPGASSIVSISNRMALSALRRRETGWARLSRHSGVPVERLKSGDLQHALSSEDWLILKYYYGLGTQRIAHLETRLKKLRAEGVPLKSRKQLADRRKMIVSLLKNVKTGRERIADRLRIEPDWITDEAAAQLPPNEKAVLEYAFGIGRHRIKTGKRFHDALFAAGVTIKGKRYTEQGIAQVKRRALVRLKKILLGDDDIDLALQKLIPQTKGRLSTELPEGAAFSHEELKEVLRLLKSGSPELTERQRLLRDVWFGMHPLERAAFSINLGLEGGAPQASLAAVAEVLSRDRTVWTKAHKPSPSLLSTRIRNAGETLEARRTGLDILSEESGVPAAAIPGLIETALDDLEKEILRLRFGLGVPRLASEKEVGERLGYPPASIYGAKSRAVRKLQKAAVASGAAPPETEDKRKVKAARDETGKRVPQWTEEAIREVIAGLPDEALRRSEMIRAGYAWMVVNAAKQFGDGSWDKALAYFGRASKDPERKGVRSSKWPEHKIRALIEALPDERLSAIAMRDEGRGHVMSVASQNYGGGSWDAALRYFGRDPEKIRRTGKPRSELRAGEKGAAALMKAGKDTAFLLFTRNPETDDYGAVRTWHGIQRFIKRIDLQFTEIERIKIYGAEIAVQGRARAEVLHEFTRKIIARRQAGHNPKFVYRWETVSTAGGPRRHVTVETLPHHLGEKDSWRIPRGALRREGRVIHQMRDAKTGTAVEIAPELGAKVISFKAGGREVLARSESPSGEGGVSILFPWAGPAENLEFRMDGKVRGLRASHLVQTTGPKAFDGMAKSARWKVLRRWKNKQGSFMELAPDDADAREMRKHFGNFELRLIYRLKGSELSASLGVRNGGTEKITAAAGFRFAFDAADEGWRLRVPARAGLPEAENLPPGTYERLREGVPLAELSFDGVVTGLFEPGASQASSFLYNPEHRKGPVVTVTQNSKLPHAFLHTSPGAVVIEPVSMAPQGFDPGRGVKGGVPLLLNPGETFTASVSLRVSSGRSELRSPALDGLFSEVNAAADSLPADFKRYVFGYEMKTEDEVRGVFPDMDEEVLEKIMRTYRERGFMLNQAAFLGDGKYEMTFWINPAADVSPGKLLDLIKDNIEAREGIAALRDDEAARTFILKKLGTIDTGEPILGVHMIAAWRKLFEKYRDSTLEAQDGRSELRTADPVLVELGEKLKAILREPAAAHDWKLLWFLSGIHKMPGLSTLGQEIDSLPKEFEPRPDHPGHGYKAPAKLTALHGMRAVGFYFLYRASKQNRAERFAPADLKYLEELIAFYNGQEYVKIPLDLPSLLYYSRLHVFLSNSLFQILSAQITGLPRPLAARAAALENVMRAIHLDGGGKSDTHHEIEIVRHLLEYTFGELRAADLPSGDRRILEYSLARLMVSFLPMFASRYGEASEGAVTMFRDDVPEYLREDVSVFLLENLDLIEAALARYAKPQAMRMPGKPLRLPDDDPLLLGFNWVYYSAAEEYLFSEMPRLDYPISRLFLDLDKPKIAFAMGRMTESVIRRQSLITSSAAFEDLPASYGGYLISWQGRTIDKTGLVFDILKALRSAESAEELEERGYQAFRAAFTGKFLDDSDLWRVFLAEAPQLKDPEALGVIQSAAFRRDWRSEAELIEFIHRSHRELRTSADALAPKSVRNVDRSELRLDAFADLRLSWNEAPALLDRPASITAAGGRPSLLGGIFTAGIGPRTSEYRIFLERIVREDALGSMDPESAGRILESLWDVSRDGLYADRAFRSSASSQPALVRVMLNVLDGADTEMLAGRFAELAPGSVVIAYDDKLRPSPVDLGAMLPPGVRYARKSYTGRLPLEAAAADGREALAKNPELEGHELLLFASPDDFSSAGQNVEEEIAHLGFAVRLDPEALRRQPKALRSKIIPAAAGEALVYARLDKELRDEILSRHAAMGSASFQGGIFSLNLDLWLELRSARSLETSA